MQIASYVTIAIITSNVVVVVVRRVCLDSW